MSVMLLETDALAVELATNRAFSEWLPTLRTEFEGEHDPAPFKMVAVQTVVVPLMMLA
jgi:hypothetical protein